jgi:hypothetical protein
MIPKAFDNRGNCLGCGVAKLRGWLSKVLSVFYPGVENHAVVE